jgi:hypothetical protein
MLSPSSRVPVVLSLVLLPVMVLSGGGCFLPLLLHLRSRTAALSSSPTIPPTANRAMRPSGSGSPASAVAISRRGSAPLCPFKQAPG